MNYEEDWLDRYKNPDFKEKIDTVFKSELSNSSCGDQVEMMLEIKDGVINKARFGGRGCVMSTVSADMLCERIEHTKTSIMELLALEEEEWIKQFPDLSPGRYNCVLLALRAMKEAVNGSR
jgi:NifU-like protein involved in Fe-S cluster formation